MPSKHIPFPVSLICAIILTHEQFHEVKNTAAEFIQQKIIQMHIFLIRLFKDQ